jgi:transposase
MTEVSVFVYVTDSSIRVPLPVLWDGLRAHRSSLVRDHVEGLQGPIHLDRLPTYAPELNPVE